MVHFVNCLYIYWIAIAVLFNHNLNGVMVQSRALGLPIRQVMILDNYI